MISFSSLSIFNLLFFLTDIRTAELVIGRSINLALSARGRKALAEVGLEEKLLEHGIPMYARMIHDLDGARKVIPYDRTANQAIYSVGRKYLNEVLLDGMLLQIEKELNNESLQKRTRVTLQLLKNIRTST